MQIMKIKQKTSVYQCCSVTQYNLHIFTSINLSLNCNARSLDVCPRLLCQRAAWETVFLLALLDQGLSVETAQTQERASVPRPAASLVTKRSPTAGFLPLTSAAPQEPVSPP